MHRLLREQEHPVSAQDLFLSLREAGSSLGLSTVYRALKEAVRAGEAHEVRGIGREVLYVASSAVFLHLVCSRCGRVDQTQDRAIGELLRETAWQLGFARDGMSVIVHGYCQSCAGGDDERSR